MEQQEKDVICADEKTQEKRNNTKPRQFRVQSIYNRKLKSLIQGITGQK